MKTGSRVIVLKNKKVLLFHRIKNNKEYYVLPGGAIEDGETPKRAAIRELKEELSIDVVLGPLLWHFKEKVNDDVRDSYYFLAKSYSGELKLGGPEKSRQSDKNVYEIKWVEISKLKSLLLYPEGLTNRILKKFNL